MSRCDRRHFGNQTLTGLTLSPQVRKRLPAFACHSGRRQKRTSVSPTNLMAARLAGPMPPEISGKNDVAHFRPQGVQQCPITADMSALRTLSTGPCQNADLLRSGNTSAPSALIPLNENTDDAGWVRPDNIGAGASLRRQHKPLASNRLGGGPPDDP